MKTLICICLSIFCFSLASGQSDPGMANYFLLRSWSNPAMTGSVENQWKVSFLHRTQWSSLENSPSTQLLVAEGDISKVGGIGIQMSNDNLGFERINTFALSFSKSISISQLKISMGLGGGMINRKVTGSSLRYEIAGDPNAITTDQNELTPDFNAGFAFSYRNFTLSTAMKHITYSRTRNYFFNVPRQFYGELTYKANLTEELEIEPSVLFKANGFINSYKFATLVTYQDRYIGGIAYESGNSATLFLGIKIKSNVQVNYSFDRIFGSSGINRPNSHEFGLSFMMIRNQKINYLSPRYM